MYALQDDLDRCTALADEIDAGRKGDRRLAAQERQIALQGPADVVYGHLLGMVGAKVQTSVGGPSAEVQQVLNNFLTNACKYTEHGSITLAYLMVGNAIEFSVTDTGSGIPADKAESIFERFEKLDSFKQGTGLGLNICRRIAELVGGRVYLDTSYTGGARFVFMHPVIIKKEKTE